MNHDHNDDSYNPSFIEQVGEFLTAFLIIAFMILGQIFAPLIDDIIIAGW